MEKKNEYSFSGLLMNGFLALFLNIALYALSIYLLILGNNNGWFICLGAVLMVLACLMSGGFVKLEPNEAKAMVFFGKYRGTLTKTGFYWVNPFYSRKSLSLRARNLNPEPIKVNDKSGNPILIGMVLVWKLEDTYKALFEIDTQSMAVSGTTGKQQASMLMRALENFVKVQSDAALRQVAGDYAYDDTSTGGDDELTLRSNADEINQTLVETLNDRLAMAGIHVIEARILLTLLRLLQ